MQFLPPAFAALGQYRQFLCYKLVPDRNKPGKNTKYPASPTTYEIVNAHEPQNWVDYQTAINAAAAAGPTFGVAFVLTAQDPFFFVDVDAALQPDRTWSPLANEIAQRFPGAAIEISSSGTGFHVIGTGVAPDHGCKNTKLGLEFYTEARFIALTGTQATGDASTRHDPALAKLTLDYFPPGVSSKDPLSDAPVEGWRGPTDDADLIRRAMQSKSVAASMGAKASFADLWTKNIDVLQKVFYAPDKLFDESGADAALASHLAFWTGNHGERIERLMRQSGLAREKYERDDYLPRTISGACALCKDVLAEPAPLPPMGVPTPPTDAPKQRRVEAGAAFLTPAQQEDHFRGCVYVSGEHKILCPGGQLLKEGPFKVLYGGATFVMDPANEKTTRDAWEAFTQSQALRPVIANRVGFKPDLPPGSVVTDSDGSSSVNIYAEPGIRKISADVTPFLRHVELLVPDDRDRALLLSYLAGCVQHKGKKFQWAPIIQGAEGNGKTLISQFTAYALGRRYVHWMHGKDLASQFNGWVARNILCCVEELKAPDTHDQDDITERLKTLITGGTGMQVQFKGVDQDSMETCVNFLITTNYRDSVRKNKDNGRRFGFFFTAQQTLADIQRSMPEGYYQELIKWRDESGYQAVANYLDHFPIYPEFDPLRHHRAPETTSTRVAQDVSVGGIEQQIQEAVDSEMMGFADGWISMKALEKLLESLRLASRLTIARRRTLLEEMGYILHPGLKDGRPNNLIQPDGCRPQIMVRRDHPTLALKGVEVSTAYTNAQLAVKTTI